MSEAKIINKIIEVIILRLETEADLEGMTGRVKANYVTNQLKWHKLELEDSNHQELCRYLSHQKFKLERILEKLNHIEADTTDEIYFDEESHRFQALKYE